jgi:hypothetical protein
VYLIAIAPLCVKAGEVITSAISRPRCLARRTGARCG